MLLTIVGPAKGSSAFFTERMIDSDAWLRPSRLSGRYRPVAAIRPAASSDSNAA